MSSPGECASRPASHDLVTERLVEDAVTRDVGPGARLLSWRLQDFTNKGDNYSSIVTSVQVEIEKEGKSMERSYVSKLNPLRPMGEISECMDLSYGREVIVLTDIMDGMNSELDKLGLSQSMTPKLLASNLEPRKQMFMTEDLRKQGFKMFDRKIGMDVPHALLVMKTLGRFHASSLLYEETLPGKSILKAFKQLEETWRQEDHPIYQLFVTMISGQVQSASQLLENIPKYEKCVEWLKNNDGFKIFTEMTYPTKPFDVLTHADCWTNNMLFKYDHCGSPIDFRLVDLQMARKASPATDLNYYFYSSLDGETRRENKHLFAVTYYLSFSKVFLMAGKEPPFSFKELNEEIDRKFTFGLLAGMLILPIIMAEGDDIPDLTNFHEDRIDNFVEGQKESFARMVNKKGGMFRDRFLSIFDDMIDGKIFDEN